MGDSLFDVFRVTLIEYAMYDTFLKWAKLEKLLPKTNLFFKTNTEENDMKLILAVFKFAETNIPSEELKLRLLSFKL